MVWYGLVGSGMVVRAVIVMSPDNVHRAAVPSGQLPRL